MIKKELIKENESLDDLQLKGYCVIQKKDGFRFGMDAVLLANFAKVKKNDVILDFCSGTGIVPFIIAGKNDFKNIIGLEIQEEMAEMARRTVIYNDLQNSVSFINGDLKDYQLLKRIGKVDVVTVNPPYKLSNSGLKNEDERNSIARHEICCNIDDVIKATSIVLKDKGKFYMIHRPERMADVLNAMRDYKIEPKVIRMIQPNMNTKPNLFLIEGTKNGGKFLKWENTLYVYDSNGNYTKELKSIYNSNREEDQ